MNRAPLYGLRVFATGMLLLALGAALVLAMFRSTLGPFTFAEIAPTAPPWRVALWSGGPEWERAQAVTRWRERLYGRFAIDHWAVFDAAALADAGDRLVIVDGASLDAETAAALRGFVERGGRLALFGVREADPDAAGHPLATLLGTEVEAARGFRWTLLPNPGGPIAAGFSPAERIPLRRVRAAYALPQERGAAHWLRAEAAAGPLSAAWRSTPGRGRLVWWSVQPDGALDRVAAQAAMTRVVRASVAWLLEEPFAELVPADAAMAAAWERVETRVDRHRGGRFLLSVSNRGARESGQVRLRLHLNRGARAVDVVQTTVRFWNVLWPDPTAHIEHHFEDPNERGDGPVVAFRGPSLAAGESRSFFVDVSD